MEEREGTERQVVSDRLLSSLWVTYSTIASSKGLVYIDDLLEMLHVKKTQLYRHLHFLKIVGFVEVRRLGKKSAVVIRRYFATKSEFEKAFREQYEKMEIGDIYAIAMEIKDKMIEYGIRGDLIGAAKIHEVVPDHSRLTQDINIVVLSEHAKFMNLLLSSMGYVLLTEKSVFPYSDVTFVVPGTTWAIFVLYDGIKHPLNPQVRFFDFSTPLREYGQVPLEHVLAAKLLRAPQLRRKEDSEDIVTVLASDVGVNLDRVARLTADVVRRFPEFESVLRRNIDTVENYVDEYELNVHVIERAKRSLNYLRDRLAEYLEGTPVGAQRVRA